MAERNMFVGLDVHKDSIAVALAESGRFGEVRHYGTVGGELVDLDRVRRDLRAPDHVLHLVYEAGPCGFAIFRHLTAHGEGCVVVSPSLTPRRPGDRVKTDRRDAETLARLHRAGELRAIYVPDEGDEAMRDLVRAREDAAGGLQRTTAHRPPRLSHVAGSAPRSATTLQPLQPDMARRAESGAISRGTLLAPVGDVPPHQPDYHPA